MVGDEKQRLDVNRIELEAALGDLEPPHKGVDPDPERVDLLLRRLRHLRIMRRSDHPDKESLGGKEVTCRLVDTDVCFGARGDSLSATPRRGVRRAPTGLLGMARC
jgi:hypothetical protein